MTVQSTLNSESSPASTKAAAAHVSSSSSSGTGTQQIEAAAILKGERPLLPQTSAAAVAAAAAAIAPKKLVMLRVPSFATKPDSVSDIWEQGKAPAAATRLSTAAAAVTMQSASTTPARGDKEQT